MKFTRAALENIEETGIVPARDLARLNAGLSPDDLLAECLDGADADRVPGWRDYVRELECAMRSLDEEPDSERTQLADHLMQDAKDRRERGE